MRKSKGFTLIELLIVVAILGILGSILFVSISGKPQARARDAKRIGDLSSLRLALELYYNDPAYASYPAPGANNTLPQALVTAGYLGALPADPKWTGTGTSCTSSAGFNYHYYMENGKYALAACLEDALPSDSPNGDYPTGATTTITCGGTTKVYCVVN